MLRTAAFLSLSFARLIWFLVIFCAAIFATVWAGPCVDDVEIIVSRKSLVNHKRLVDVVENGLRRAYSRWWY